MDASTKVTCLLDGIQTDSLDAVKVIIMQDSELGRDFEMCITFYKYFIKRSSGNHGKETSRVGEVGLHSNSNYDVEYRYYLKEEYKKISTNAKEKLRKLCKGRPPGETFRGRGDRGNILHKNIGKLEQQTKKLHHTVKKLEAKQVSNYGGDKSNSSESDNFSSDEVGGPNRNPPALMRQVTGKGESKRGGEKR